MAVPGDYNIKVKELGKFKKYPDLRVEVVGIWDVQETVAPVIIGGRFEPIPQNLYPKTYIKNNA